MKHSDGRWSINPDETQHPRVQAADRGRVTYDSVTRAELNAGKAAQVAQINRTSDRNQFDRLTPPEQATLLRWLTDQLATDKAAATRVRPILTDWKRRGLDHDAALDKLRDLLTER